MISKVTGMKMCVWLVVEYLDSFLVAAASDTAPGVKDLDATEEVAKVSTTVAPQIRHRPLCQGTKVRPSGHLPSPLRKPVGSLVAEMSARLKDRHNRSLT